MQHQDPLKNLYLLRDADADDLTAVTALAKRQRFRAGERIFHEGDEAHAMYLVALGTVEILVSGDETMVAVIGSGGEFGEIAFFDRGEALGVRMRAGDQRDRQPALRGAASRAGRASRTLAPRSPERLHLPGEVPAADLARPVLRARAKPPSSLS